jgi:glycosyltransferase involved in cell wall biosynthesis
MYFQKVPTLSVAVCTYNRAERLETLVFALKAQECPVPFEIVFINNSSQDQTAAVLEKLKKEIGPLLRSVYEEVQGIVPARNRALEECRGSKYIFFMDDDELPEAGLLNAVIEAFEIENADCVGGRVKVHFEPGQRPSWLGDELLGFLAEVDYGAEAFWVTDDSTPVWTANAAFRTSLFENGLRFNNRYNRKGKSTGGGEDRMMFRDLFKKGARIRYRPDMVVTHFIEDWRLKRRYFLKLHFGSGYKTGRWEMDEFDRLICGVPPFLVAQALRHCLTSLKILIARRAGLIRQCMTAAHAVGMIIGCFENLRETRKVRNNF